MGMVFRHSGEYNLYNNMTAAQKAQWQKWSSNNPKGTFDNWLSKYGPPLGLPARAPAAAAGDLGTGGGSTASGQQIPAAAANPAFTPEQQKAHNDAHRAIIDAGLASEATWEDFKIQHQQVLNQITRNFEQGASDRGDEQAGRGLTATGVAAHHIADLTRFKLLGEADQEVIYRAQNTRHNNAITRGNNDLAQLGEEGNILKAIQPGAAPPRNLNAAAAPAAPAAPAAAPTTNPNPASEGYGNPQYDPRAAPAVPGPPAHQPAQNYAQPAPKKRVTRGAYLLGLRARTNDTSRARYRAQYTYDGQ